MADNSATIEANLAAPKRVQSDGIVVEQHPLPDQIAADRYVQAKEAARKTGSLGIRLQKLKPPGAD